jgi:glycosyltransferase involved in cell wall biosynthesis
MSTALPITVIIPAYNEELRIGDALKSVGKVDEILVADSYSTDKTAEIARSYGARIIQRTFDYPANQKNWAIPQARNEWILLLDADERAHPNLLQELADLLQHGPTKDGYWIPRENIFMGRTIKHSWSSDKVVRFFKRDVCRYNDRRAHEEIIDNGNLGMLKNRLIHYTYRSLDHYVEKLNRYAEWQAEDYDAKTGSITIYHLWLKPAFRFVKHFLLKLGFLDGVPGLTIAYYQAYAVRLRYLKLAQLRRGKRS